jgi:general secretion pathway protein G
MRSTSSGQVLPISSGPTPEGWRLTRCRCWPSVLTALGLALGAGLCVSALRDYGLEHRARRRAFDLSNIEMALKLHYARTGRYPTTEEGLEALVRCGALHTVPIDSWNRPYYYALLRGRPMLWTFGQDGVPGGEGLDADVYNVSWQKPPPP